MSWPRTVIWWHVYPLGFVGAEPQLPADPTVEHRLPGVEWLDYLVELGCNGLALGPVFASQTHGYDTIDHLRIDPRLGDDADFDALVAAAHERGIRVLLDGVFNHVGRTHPRFETALRDGPHSEAARWFRFTADSEGRPVPEVFEGHEQLVALDHDHDEVVDLVVEVMDHWLSRGADGWRLDAAYAVPAAFWARVLPRVRERHPDAWFVGEMIHGDYAGYVTESTLDSVTAYELWKAVWSSLREHNFYELSWTLGRHQELLETFVPMTFLGNHDVTRLASQVQDRRLIAPAVLILCVVPGVPSVYYGDELGLEAVKEERFGGDDAIRPEFPDRPADLDPDHNAVHRAYRRLIGLRRRNPWLVDGRVDVSEVANEQLKLVITSADGSQRIVVLINLGDTATTFGAEDSEDGEAGDDLNGAVLESSEPVDDPAVVPSYGWTVLAG